MAYFLALFACVTACFMLPNIVWQLLNRKKLDALAHPLCHRVWTWIYWLYCALVLHLTGIGTLWDLFSYGGVVGNIHLLPFSEEATIPNILNLIMLMPFGFLLPLIWQRWRSFGRVVLAGFGFSLLIEVFQLFNTRLSDVDDLIMNSLGTAAGYVTWMLYHRLFGSKEAKSSDQAIQGEAILYLLLGFAGVFLLYNWRPVSDLFS